MKFETPLISCTLLLRHHRFLAEVRLEDGSETTAHIANTGSMLGCATPGSPAALSYHPGRGRKHPYSVELVQVDGVWVCVNTSRPNAIVEEAVEQGLVPSLRGYPSLRREVRYGENSRIDLLLSDADRLCYVEVKNVTLRVGDLAAFPDAVTARGRKHLLELMGMVREGHRAVMFFLVNRGDCTAVRPADEIDPDYGDTLREAVRYGVELLAYRTRITLEGIEVDQALEVLLDR